MNSQAQRKDNEKTTTTIDQQQKNSGKQLYSRGLSNNHFFDEFVANQWFSFNLEVL